MLYYVHEHNESVYAFMSDASATERVGSHRTYNIAEDRMYHFFLSFFLFHSFFSFSKMKQKKTIFFPLFEQSCLSVINLNDNYTTHELSLFSLLFLSSSLTHSCIKRNIHGKVEERRNRMERID